MESIINYLQSTMLIERLVGVCVYILTLGYFYNRIQHAKSAEDVSRYLNHYLIVLCIMAFIYIPGTSADLYRWRNLAEPWKDSSFSWFLNNRVLPSSTPLSYLFIYICQMTGINGLLPMLSALGFYGNVFHILKCESKREARSSDSIAVTLLFVMSSGVFLEVISGIRCMLAFSIVLRFAYDEMYQGKSLLRSVAFYAIAALLHNAAIPLLGIRLACVVFEKKSNIGRTILNILLAILSIFMAIRFGADYIDAAFEKANSYTSRNVYLYSWEYLIAALGLFILIPILIKFKKRYPKDWKAEIISVRYLLIVLAAEVFFVRTYSIFHRFFTVAVIVSIPWMLTFLNSESENNRNRYNRNRSRQYIVIMSMLVLLLACVRGNLCGYKFFLLG